MNAAAVALVIEAAVAALSPQPYCRVGDPVTAREVFCLAENVYREARGDGVHGMIAVGLVTANRVRSRHYPATFCDVVFQRAQFAWTEKPERGIAEPVAFAQAAEIAVGIISGRINSPKFSATHFESGRRPYWSRSLHYSGRIGHHRFYEEIASK